MIKKSELLKLINGDLTVDLTYLKLLADECYAVIGHDTVYYRLFYHLAKLSKPAFVVELGTWRGFASAHFAAGNPDGTVIAVDIHKDDKFAQQRVMQICNDIPNMNYINEWTWDAVPSVKAFGLPIDILFIDAWHNYEYAMREWKLYEPLLAKDALVICDDIFDDGISMVGMVKFWQEVTASPNIRWHILNSDLHQGIPMGFAYYSRGG